MTTFFFLTTWLFAAALAALVFFHLRLRGKFQDAMDRHSAKTESLQADADERYDRLKSKAETALNDMKSRLSRYQSLVNAEDEAERIRGESAAAKEEANRLLDAAGIARSAAEGEAAEIIKAGKKEQQELKKQGVAIVERANGRAATIVEQANTEAKRLSETAFDILRNTDRYQKALIALKNKLRGTATSGLSPFRA